MPVDLDPPTRAIMATLADAGYIVTIGRDPDGGIVGSARDGAGETWVAWAADGYAAVCELAGRVGAVLPATWRPGRESRKDPRFPLGALPSGVFSSRIEASFVPDRRGLR